MVAITFLHTSFELHLLLGEKWGGGGGEEGLSPHLDIWDRGVLKPPS